MCFCILLCRSCRFGGSSIKKAEQEAEKKKLAEKKAAIGYNYDGEGSTDQGGFRGVLLTDEKESLEEADGEGQVDSEEEFDLDIVFDVDHIPSEQAREMNLLSTTYGGSCHSLHRKGITG